MSNNYNNLQNISDEDLETEIEARLYMLIMPSRNLSMQNIIQNRLNLLLAEQRRRQRRTKMTTRKRGGRKMKRKTKKISEKPMIM
jgi:hypothetical protein